MGILKDIFKDVESGREEARRESENIRNVQRDAEKARAPRYDSRTDETGCKIVVATDRDGNQRIVDRRLPGQS